MLLNLGIIQSNLAINPKYSIGEIFHKMALRDVRVLPQGSDVEYDNSFLYVGIFEIIKTKNTLPQYLMCIGGNEDAKEFLQKFDLCGFVYDDTIDWIELFSNVQSSFEYYRDAYIMFRTMLIQQSSIHDIIAKSECFFGTPVFLLDAELKLLESSLDSNSSAPDVIKKNKEHLAELKKVTASINKQEFLGRNHNLQMVQRVDGNGGTPEYCFSCFYDGNQLLAILVVYKGEKLLNPPVLQYIANILQPCIRGRFSAVVLVHGYIRSVISNMVAKRSNDANELVSHLERMGWNVKDEYRLVLVRMRPDSYRSVKVVTNFYLYEGLFPDCIATRNGDNVVIIVHNITEEILEKSIENLRTQINALNMECCIGLPFNDFTQLHSHFALAEATLNIGKLGETVCFCYDYLPEYMINELNTLVDVRAVCHIAAIKIWEYDKENQTELLLTLETYLLHNRSLQAAAAELFIHRNTLNYRLNSIMSIAQLSLDSAKERFHLLCSCIFLKYLENEKK